EQVPLHGGPSLVGLRAEEAWGSEPAGLEKACAGELDPETSRLPLRMGSGRARGSDALAGSRDACTPAGADRAPHARQSIAIVMSTRFARWIDRNILSLGREM